MLPTAGLGKLQVQKILEVRGNDVWLWTKVQRVCNNVLLLKLTKLWKYKKKLCDVYSAICCQFMKQLYVSCVCN